MILLRAAVLVLLVSHGGSTPTQTPTSATHEHVVCGDDAALWNPRIAEGSFGVAGNWIPSGVPDESTVAQIYGTMGSHESSDEPRLNNPAPAPVVERHVERPEKRKQAIAL